MFDVKDKPKMVERAMLVGLYFDKKEKKNSQELLDELIELVETLKISIVKAGLFFVREKKTRLLLGSGKAQEIKEIVKKNECDVLIFDEILSPGQQRNWESELGNILVIDRQEVIIDIFAMRARTQEANLQVELARLNYNLPRLQKAWSHLDRQRGGGGVTQRGEGEAQLELDQRMVRNRISTVKRELNQVIQIRKTQRKRRIKIPLPSAAIVGYTNAGKSSLLNRLTNSTIFVEDQLFATLDPTTRRLSLPSKKVVLLSDTVGFIRKLPHDLVDAFKATLEEAMIADFLIHVLDASSPSAIDHYETTLSVLKSLGANEKKMIVVLNKMDLIPSSIAKKTQKLRFPDAFPISVKENEGIDALLRVIDSELTQQVQIMKLKIPHSRYDVIHKVYINGQIGYEKHLSDGVLLTVTIPNRLVSFLEPFLLSSSVN